MIDVLIELVQVRGVPRHIRSDNGPEFIARFLMQVLAIHGVAPRHIEPGSPWQNAFNERFNGTLRDECLNLETFHNRDHARAIVKLFGRSYNERRPHSALGYLTPNDCGRAAGGDGFSPPEDTGAVTPLSSEQWRGSS